VTRTRTPTAWRDGFTLIELLVVIAVISTLVGLLLPAVQKARDAASRIQCTNNLKQIVLAIHGYHDVYGEVPSSRLSDFHASWAVLILPWLEQQNLYNQWVLPNTYYAQSDVARLTPVPVYFCPARRTAQMSPQASISGDQNDDGFGGPPTPGALGDYAVCAGTDLCDGTDCAAGQVTNGAFRVKVGNDPWTRSPTSPATITFTHITDGLSNTIFVGDKHVKIGGFGMGALGVGGPPDPTRLDGSLYNGDYLISFGRAAGPNYPLAQTPQDSTVGFGSWHTGVCQFAFGDGRVQSLALTTDPVVLALLANVSDGQTIPNY
jgi:prepilin-type N-terminal cleavage/methylation domain-containing protein